MGVIWSRHSDIPFFFKESFKQQFLYQNTGTVPFFVPFLTARANTLSFLVQLLYTRKMHAYASAKPVSQPSTGPCIF